MTTTNRPIRTYLDPSVLIGIMSDRSRRGRLGQAILEDSRRTFLTSEFVTLECLPTAIYHRDLDQRAFFESYMTRALDVGPVDAIVRQALIEGAACGTAGIDACHLAAAVLGSADELITDEKPTKPMCRCQSVKVVSLR